MSLEREDINSFFQSEERVLNWGVVPARPDPRSQYLKEWVESGYHSDLQYMENNLSQRMDMTQKYPWAKSVLLFSFAYKHPVSTPRDSEYKVARYAQDSDYHYYCKDILKRLEELFKKENQQFFGFVDSHPIFERSLALEAGLGWSGKNCCTIHPDYGSSFLLAGALIDVDLVEQNKPQGGNHLPDYCGSCTRCIEACPTDAFIQPGSLDANKCISYWTIENKTSIPKAVSQELKGWVFGCDICQDVCPWNIKSAKRRKEPPLKTEFDKTALEWLTLLRKGGGFQSAFKHSSLTRAGRKRMLRNVAIVIGNKKDRECLSLLKEIKAEEEDEFVLQELETTLLKLEQGKEE